MDLSLTQRQSLLTKLSPQQIQIVRLLEIPGVELQRRINEELQENPALDEGKDPQAIREEDEQKRSEEFDGDEYGNDSYANDESDADDYREASMGESYSSEASQADTTYNDSDYANPLDNPEFNYDDYVTDDETPDYKTRITNYSDPQDTMDNTFI